eukprot:373066-Hanusia_phi.AAC.1
MGANEEEREIQPSKLCSIDSRALQYVCGDNKLPEGFTEAVTGGARVLHGHPSVHVGPHDLPEQHRGHRAHAGEPIDTVRQLHVGEQVRGGLHHRRDADEARRALPQADPFPRAALRDGRAEHDVQRADGGRGSAPQPPGRDPRGAQHQRRRQDACLTNFAVQTQVTLMKYRGDNANSKADAVRMKMNRQDMDSLHHQLKESIRQNDGAARDMMEDHGLSVGGLPEPGDLRLAADRDDELRPRGGQLHGHQRRHRHDQGDTRGQRRDAAPARQGRGGHGAHLRDAERGGAQHGRGGPLHGLLRIDGLHGAGRTPVDRQAARRDGQVHGPGDQADGTRHDDDAAVADGALLPVPDALQLVSAQPVRGPAERRPAGSPATRSRAWCWAACTRT